MRALIVAIFILLSAPLRASPPPQQPAPQAQQRQPEQRNMPLPVLLAFAGGSVLILFLIARSVSRSRTFGRRPPGAGL